MELKTQVTSLIMRQMRRPLITLICAYAISMLGLVLIPGVDDQNQVWHMSFFHAFYFVSYTATTIGYGEIPYALTDTQRIWVLFTLYMTVISWFYAIGKILSLVQDDAFRKVLTESRFYKDVRQLKEPFFLICGFGDTGKALVRTLTERHRRAVVIDNDERNINELVLKDYHSHVPGLTGNVHEPNTLIIGGLTLENCEGVISLTNCDEVNLKVSVTAKLLNPDTTVISRADSAEIVRNLESFKTDFVIDPFVTFADMLSVSLQSPSLFLLHDWLTGVPESELTDPPYPPRGHWILCGFGRFGQTVYKVLVDAGLDVVVVANNVDDSVRNHIKGAGTEAVTLYKADIENAVAIIAGTDDDSTNLSILMTALDINLSLFVISRQNRRDNNLLFESVHCDIVMQPGETIARKIRMLLTIPLLTEFMTNARQQDNEWANILISRLCAITGDIVPYLWAIEITPKKAGGVCSAINFGRKITLEILQRDPHSRDKTIPCIPLLIIREKEERLLPGDDLELVQGDKILFCGGAGTAAKMDWTLNNTNTLNYVMTGCQSAECLLWRKFNYYKTKDDRRREQRRNRKNTSLFKQMFFKTPNSPK
ncbi:MAG: potassium channel family protein [Methylococcales bacterium]|jgi:voltage-gated potassium channel|nr:potassium channel family protein [Methylococcales bacterium]MBT7411283.1 potassium channel family protein [Methylococcales bacterium]